MWKVVIIILNLLSLHHANGNYKNNPNIVETVNHLLFRVLKCPFLKTPLPGHKLRMSALPATQTANCQHGRAHQLHHHLGVESQTGHGESLRERKGKNRSLHSYTSTQPTSAKSTSFKWGRRPYLSQSNFLSPLWHSQQSRDPGRHPFYTCGEKSPRTA